MTETSNVIDFATGAPLDADGLARIKSAAHDASADDGIGEDFRAMLDQVAPVTARLVGTHRGVLAGLGPEERAAAIDAYLAEGAGMQPDDAYDEGATGTLVPFDDADADGGSAVPLLGEDDLDGAESLYDLLNVDPVEVLLDACESGPVRTKLSQLLINAPVEWLHDVAGDYGLGDLVNGSRKKLAARLATAMAASLQNMQLGLSGLSSTQFRGLRQVFEAGGVLEVRDDEVTAQNIERVPAPVPPLVFCFHREGDAQEPGVFTFVIAEEFVQLMAGVDWDAAEEPIKKRIVLGRYLDAAVHMRGIVVQEELEDGYLVDVEDGFDDPMEIATQMPYAMREVASDAWVLLPPDDPTAYLLAGDLGSRYLEDHPECEPEDGGVLIDGELDPMLEELLDAQAQYEPAPVTPQMLAAEDYLSWQEGIPAAVELRAFIDEHVPDGEDDHFYADGFLESVQMLAHTGFTPEEYRLYLERLYPVDDPELLTRAWELSLAVVEQTPRWDLNGWSVRQAAELE